MWAYDYTLEAWINYDTGETSYNGVDQPPGPLYNQGAQDVINAAVGGSYVAPTAAAASANPLTSIATALRNVFSGGTAAPAAGGFAVTAPMNFTPLILPMVVIGAVILLSGSKRSKK